MSANVKETWHDQLLAKWRGVWVFFCHGIESFLNPLTPISDQVGISPSPKISIMGLLIDSIPNSPN